MSPPLVSLTGITAGYGDVTVLRGVDLEVHRGEVVALLGANGAGKTTLLRTLIGAVPLRSGRVEVDGRQVLRPQPSYMVRCGVVLVPEGRHVFPTLTVEENLRAGGHTVSRGLVRQRVAEAFEMFPVLAEKRRDPAGLLSGGQQQMLAIARGLMAGPSVLLLDEPSMGLAPLVVDELGATLRDLAGEGTTMVLVEQNVGLAERVAGRGYVLEAGKIVAQGAVDDLLGGDVVAQIYLGTAGRPT